VDSKTVNLFTSWSLDSGVGSGVATVVKDINATLQKESFTTNLLSSSHKSSSYFGSSFGRVLYNLFESNASLGKTPTIAFDFDGFFFGKDVRFASINGGVLGDIVGFESGSTKMILKLLAGFEKRACQKAEVVFTPSMYSARKISSLYSIPMEKIKIMHNGIFFDEWVDEINSAKKDEQRALTVLAVARLYKRKGLDRLINSWVDVVKEYPKAVLSIVGTGLEEENLKKLSAMLSLQGSVKFEGEILNRSRLARCYRNCDIFALPSRHETFGIVYLEAMSAGKPVVALNSTALPEVVRNGIDGILVDEDDEDALSKAIVSLLGDKAKRKSMGENGRVRVKDNFDWSKVIIPLLNWITVYGKG